jgi:hypothetical protein
MADINTGAERGISVAVAPDASAGFEVALEHHHLAPGQPAEHERVVAVEGPDVEAAGARRAELTHVPRDLELVEPEVHVQRGGRIDLQPKPVTEAEGKPMQPSRIACQGPPEAAAESPPRLDRESFQEP